MTKTEAICEIKKIFGKCSPEARRLAAVAMGDEDGSDTYVAAEIESWWRSDPRPKAEAAIEGIIEMAREVGVVEEDEMCRLVEAVAGAAIDAVCAGCDPYTRMDLALAGYPALREASSVASSAIDALGVVRGFELALLCLDAALMSNNTVVP